MPHNDNIHDPEPHVKLTKRYGAIPAELKALPQWVCYKIETRDGKSIKVPYSANGRRAKSNDPTTWHTFQEAIDAAADRGFDGIGFVLSESDPYVFIDLDHVVYPNDSNGNDSVDIELWAQDIIARVNSYTELSRSGTGIHVIARAQKPGSSCRTNKYPRFEIYDHARLVVFTGQVLPNAPAVINDAQKAVTDIYYEMFGSEPEAQESHDSTPQPTAPVSLSDDELIEKALTAANGEKFRRLWSGDTSDYGGDASSADMALCSMLRFWTGADRDRIDRLFRRSGLMRPKWNERRGSYTYGQITIDAVLEKGGETYTCPDRARLGNSVNTGCQSYGLPPTQFAAQYDTNDPDLPVIRADCHDLATITSQCWDAIVRSNNPPRLFRYLSIPSRLECDDNGILVPQELTLDKLRHELARCARWVTGRKDEPAKPPIDVVKDMLAMPNPPLPVLTRITDIPVFGPDGSLQTAEGYSSVGKTYRMSRPGLQIPEIPTNPTAADVEAAKYLIIGDMIAEFPFVQQADRAHAVALLLLPFVRDLIDGPTPNHLIEAPEGGTGKSLLADTLLTPACGRQVSIISEARDDDEWRKRITAQLRGARSVVLLDNVRHSLSSGPLAAALTAVLWEDRLLGKSQNLQIPVRCVWVTTSNNPTMTTEMARRCIRIRLDAKMDQPWNRTGFRHPNLRAWALAHRGELIAAALTLVQSWVAAGMPTSDARPLGSYEQWAAVMGGILNHIEVPGFLDNLPEFYEQADIEGAMWRQFVAAWWEKFGQERVGVSDLFSLALELDVFDFGKGNERSQKTAFGRRLGQQRDRVIGEHRVVSAGTFQRANQWMLVPISGQLF